MTPQSSPLGQSTWCVLCAETSPLCIIPLHLVAIYESRKYKRCDEINNATRTNNDKKTHFIFVPRDCIGWFDWRHLVKKTAKSSITWEILSREMCLTLKSLLWILMSLLTETCVTHVTWCMSESLTRDSRTPYKLCSHYEDVTMSTIATQFNSLRIVYSRRRSKKTSKLHVTGLCEGNSSVNGKFPAQRVSDTEKVSRWWRHHGTIVRY